VSSWLGPWKLLAGYGAISKRVYGPNEMSKNARKVQNVPLALASARLYGDKANQTG